MGPVDLSPPLAILVSVLAGLGVTVGWSKLYVGWVLPRERISPRDHFYWVAGLVLGYGFFYALALLLMPEGEGFTLWFYVLLAIAVAWVVLIFHAFDSTVERVDCCLVCEKMRKSS